MERNKLITMVEFVDRIDELCPDKDTLNTGKLFARQVDAIKRYAKFLSQPLTLGMFVPCDSNSNPMEEPKKPWQDKIMDEGLHGYYNLKMETWNKAKERVLFEGYTFEAPSTLLYKNNIVWIGDVKGNVEELANMKKFKLTLTPKALKEIYGS